MCLKLTNASSQYMRLKRVNKNMNHKEKPNKKAHQSVNMSIKNQDKNLRTQDVVLCQHLI